MSDPNVEHDEQQLGVAAAGGDRQAFERLIQGALPRLRATVRRIVGHPEQARDLVQDALTRAWASIGGFHGRSSFATWLCRIGVNVAIDFVRGEQRWRQRAQIAYANECTASPERGMEVGGVLMAPDFHYDVKEHVSFCFTCVARSLDPDLQAALVLREVEQLSNLEAARAVGVSESVLRHRLAQARSTMEQAFEGLCALVNKQGVCYQCSGLRDVVPEGGRRGEPPPESLSFEQRLEIVRRADTDTGVAQPLHDLFWRRIADQEATGRGSVEVSAECAPDGEAT